MPPYPTPEASDPESHGRSLRSGRVIFSRYRLERPLGRGGMGVVWLAYDRNLDRPLALKFLAEKIYAHPEARDALKGETRRGVELGHVNIVRVHDFVEDGEAGAIALEYIDGATLTELRLEHRQACLEVGGLGSWVAELCRAVDYAHQSTAMVHGDLKPANLLISSDGVLKVADFGVGSALRRIMANVAENSGSLGYMSPQQLRGDAPAFSDDIYSIAAILYEALTSRPPMVSLQINGRSTDSMTNRRLKLGVAGEPIPENWEQTILACLEKEPQNRPASVAEIAQRLEISLVTHLQTSSSAGEVLAITPTPVAAGRPIPVAADQRSRATQSSMGSTALLSSAFSAAAAILSRSRSEVAPTLLEMLGTKSASTWRWLGRRKDRALGAAIVAAGVVLVATYWPQSDEPKELRPAHRSKEAAIPAYAITAPVPVSLAPEIAASGGLIIRSDPPGAAITVDGLPAELTPASVKDVSPGEHAVGLQLVGFDKVSIPAKVQAGQVTDLGTIALQRSSGTLQVTTDPPGALIMLGERELGRTPLTVKLSSGAYRAITAHLDGYVDTSFDATVGADETLALPPMMLKPEPPRLAITTEPAGIPFQLFQGSAQMPTAKPVSTGVTPASVGDLRPGTYRVVFGGATLRSESIDVAVGERGTTPLHRVFSQGTLKVESTPAGAEVFNGETSLGVTPLTVALVDGTHVITAELNDRSARPRTVKIVSGKTESLRFDFTPSTSTPSHARKPRKKEEPGALTKIGRSIKNFFH